MSELSFITTEYTGQSSISNHQPRARNVIGVTSSDSSTVVEYGHSLSGTEQEEIVEISEEKAERIVEFFAQTFARDPSERPFYNCHVFAYWALGKVTVLRKYECFDGIFISDPADETELKPGDVYCTMNSSGVVNHSLIATEPSGKNMSVLGDNQQLAIMSSEDILKFYDATRLTHFSPTIAY